MQVGNDVYAEIKLSEVTRLAPGEPAGWANWGVLALRQRNFDAAAQRVERARDLAPEDGHIYNLLGALESNRGHSAQAIAALRKAADLNPQDLRTAYALAQEIERQRDPSSEAEFQQVIQKILAAQPDNLAALLELTRVAAKRGDAGTLKLALARISSRSAAWPSEVQQQLRPCKLPPTTRIYARPATGRPHCATRSCAFGVSSKPLRPSKQLPEGVSAVHPFSALESPVFKAAPADTELTFDPQPVTLPAAVMELDRGHPAWRCRRTDRCRSEWHRGASVHRRDASVPRWTIQSCAVARRCLATRLQLRFQDGPRAGRRGRCAPVPPGQSESLHRRDGGNQIVAVRGQRPLYRCVRG